MNKKIDGEEASLPSFKIAFGIARMHSMVTPTGRSDQ
jgi:hypothetical protein